MRLACGRVEPISVQSDPRPNEESQKALIFLGQALQAFARAESASSLPADIFYCVGNHSLRLRFANDTLVPLIGRAFAHVRTPPIPEPELTICLWDSASTGAEMPPPPWDRNAYSVGGEIQGMVDERLHVSFQQDCGILSILDHTERTGIYWTKTARQIPTYEIASPLRLLLYPWFLARNLLPVHAGAIGLNGSGILLAGKGGSGKSTTALGCLASGLQYASDDFCLLQSSPSLMAFSLYSTGKLRPHDLARFPSLEGLVGNPDRTDGDKAVLFLNEHFPDKIARHLLIRAIWIPRIGTNTISRLEPATPAAALTALAPGTLPLLPSAARRIFALLGQIVRLVPCYYLDLGQDPLQTSDLVRDFLLHGSASD